MDNVCHTLVGAALGEAGLKQRTRFGAAALMIASNLPDIDVLVFATGTPSIAFRRGLTHGVAAQVVLPLMLAGVLWLVDKHGPARATAATGPPLRVGWLLASSYIGVWLHVFFDYLNNYGIRLLAPFDWRWFYGDAVFIIDPWLWLVLGAGVWLARRRRKPLPSRAALILAGCYIALMLTAARVARGVVVDRWQQEYGIRPRALMVGPVPVTPFTREVIVDAGRYYRRGTFSWPSSVVFDEERVPKNDELAEVAEARAAPNVLGFLVWSRFPFWRVEPMGRSSRVTVTDARFMVRGGMFSASTIVPRRTE